MKIVLKGNPKSTGRIYRTTCRGRLATVYMVNEGKALKKSYIQQARTQRLSEPITGDVMVDMVLYFGDKRKRDIDNFNKLVFDSLTGIVWVDDVQIQELHIIKKYDKLSPRVELYISEL